MSRDKNRTPMQWSTEENAGFSAAKADALERPVPIEIQVHTS